MTVALWSALCLSGGGVTAEASHPLSYVARSGLVTRVVSEVDTMIGATECKSQARLPDFMVLVCPRTSWKRQSAGGMSSRSA